MPLSFKASACHWYKTKASLTLHCELGIINSMDTNHEYSSPHLKTMAKCIQQGFHRTSCLRKGLVFASKSVGEWEQL